VKAARGVLPVALLALFFSVGGGGREARAEDEAEGRVHFARGQELFQAKRFLEAAHEFEAGFEAAPRPLFLLNIGHSYRRAGQFRKAKSVYELLLRVEPNTPHRKEVEGLIKTIDDALESAEPLPAAPPRPAPPVRAAPVVPAAPAPAPGTPTPPPVRPPAPTTPVPAPSAPRAPRPAPAPRASSAPAGSLPAPAASLPAPATSLPAPAASLPAPAGSLPAAATSHPSVTSLPASALPASATASYAAAPPEPEEEAPRSMWKSPWLWGAIGSAIVAGTVVAVMSSSGTRACSASGGCFQEPRLR
jgi:hypothetical protein